ncbi:uncharacterized protein LOC111332204 isoform X2 [Stylophora pistillata]|uniref:uncharacterized protein LOC111332204 isoform X2 n=1 Tax=Stylophora pistillata TaxID=50429 RepID=UPI000C05287F|nr:uncharacterized protein LOC111332204 isoform X2 [Stylophora pistillata]
MFGPLSSTPEGGDQGMSLTPGVATRPPLPPGNRMPGEYPVVPPRDPSFSSLHLVCVPVRLTQWSTCLTYNRALYILRHHGNTF